MFIVCMDTNWYGYVPCDHTKYSVSISVLCVHTKHHTVSIHVLCVHTKRGLCGGELVEHSSAKPKVPGSIPGPVSYRGHGL